MKVVGCWMYVINKYGFPPQLEDMFKGIKELGELGFRYIELEGVGKENLMEVVNHREDFLGLLKSLGVKLTNFAVILPDIFSMNKSSKKEALKLFEKGVETAKHLNSDFIWIDSFMPPVEIKEGKVFSDTIEFGAEVKVKIPPDFVWKDFTMLFSILFA